MNPDIAARRAPAGPAVRRVTAALAALAVLAILQALPAAADPQGLSVAAEAERQDVAQAPPGQSTICDLTAPGRIVAVGDVHGAFDRYTTILRAAGLIDGRRRWTGGTATFVQLGDVLDRGADSRRVLDLIKQLEGEAEKAGGRVVLLLGNHEVMRMGGDLRDVSRGEYDAFRSPDAADLRERLFQHLATQHEANAKAKGEKFDSREFRKTFLASTPLGSVEMQIAFSESGEYGRWLRQHGIMARINGTVFVHGGVTPAVAARGCAAINDAARTEIATLRLGSPGLDKALLWSSDGPLWYRGLAGVEPAATEADVTAALTALGATRIVVGHTVSPTGRVRALHGGRVIAVDTGMLAGEHYPGGAAAALEMHAGALTAIYENRREDVGKSAVAVTTAPSPPVAPTVPRQAFRTPLNRP